MSVVAFGQSSILGQTQQGMTYCHQEASVPLKFDAIVWHDVVMIYEYTHNPGP